MRTAILSLSFGIGVFGSMLPVLAHAGPPGASPCALPGANTATACDDGNLCTTGDNCGNGGCLGTPLPCSSKDPCEVAFCDVQSGTCKTLRVQSPACAPKPAAPPSTGKACHAGTSAGCGGWASLAGALVLLCARRRRT